MSPAGVRFAALGLAWCFAVIASSMGLNALVKSNKDKSRLKKLALSQGTVVDIDTQDIFIAGTVATTMCLCISVLIGNFVSGLYMPHTKAFLSRTQRLQGVILLIFSIFLFAAMIPYMLFFFRRSAVTTAFIQGIKLPDALVQQVVEASGTPSRYKEIYYLKLCAIFPWFSFVATLIAAILLIRTPAVPPATSTTLEGSDSSSVMQEKEKPEYLEVA